MMRFAFGKNWQSYVHHALTPEKVHQARNAFQELFDGIDLHGKSFLDIGFGQGIALFLAQEMGANVMGIDIDQDNVATLRKTATLFHTQQLPKVRIASILEETFIQELCRTDQFDAVHAWGVLHHTGDMNRAIHNAASLVGEGGYLVLAIYNKHWSSPLWRGIKWVYNKSPLLVQNMFIRFFYPIIYVAKLLVTRKNPKQKNRGMDFFYDVVDWVGGYPYEYAPISAIQELVCQKQFVCLRVIPANVPTGCNQFVFKKL